MFQLNLLGFAVFLMFSSNSANCIKFSKSTAMRKSIFFSTVLSLFLLVPASIIWAQTISTQKGLTTAVFNTPAGTIKVYLPDDIRPGEVISGTVLAEPIGKNAKQVEKNLSELIKYTVSIDGNRTSVPSKPGLMKWLLHSGGKQISPIELINGSGAKVGQLSFPLNNLDKTISASLQNCNHPSHVLVGTPVNITGPFDGDASNTKCSLGSTPAEVLAESPRQCIFKYPADAVGLQTLDITDNNEKNSQTCNQRISGVSMDVSAGKLNLSKGERTYIDIKISGLQGLPDTAILSLNNISPATVTMMPANTIVIPLSPATESSGIFTRKFDIQSIKSGTFSVNVNLDLPDNSSTANQIDLSDLKNESGYPGSYGYIGDQPCDPEGATVRWRWHKTFACEIDDRKVLPCGHSKEGNDVYEKIKELLEELELDKATDIGEKMAKAFSTSKMFSYSIHVIRKWVDYDIEYKCVNGKWQSTGGMYVRHGTDDLGWHSVRQLTLDCWTTFDAPAAEKEFEAALELALRGACK